MTKLCACMSVYVYAYICAHVYICKYEFVNMYSHAYVTMWAYALVSTCAYNSMCLSILVVFYFLLQVFMLILA